MANVKLKHFYTLLWVALGIFILADSARLGCFKENRRRPVYHRNPGGIEKGTMTAAKCTGICGAFQFSYAAVRAGEFCFCSHTAPSPELPLEADGNCSIPCVGDLTATCGSLTHVEVFNASEPMEVTLSLSPQLASTGDTVTLVATVSPSNPYAISMNYDDSAGGTGYQISSNSPVLDRTFRMAGDYIVEAHVTSTDQLLPDTISAAAVTVHSQASGVTITCPGYMATFEPEDCFIEVLRGTNINLTMSYTDAAPVQLTFPIADAEEFFMGSTVQENLAAPLVSTSTNGLVVHQAYPAENTGFLVGVEFYGNGVGSVPIAVYRPDCGSNEYCYDSNSCVATGTCNPTCGVSGYCAAIDSCCGLPTSRPAGLVIGATYNLVHSTSVSVTSGYGYVTLPGTFEVQPGDVLVHTGTASDILAMEDTGTVTDSDWYCNSLATGATFSDSTCTTTSIEIHQLKAVYAKKSNVVVPLKFTVPSNITVTATVNNRDITTIGTVQDATVIVVVEGVDAALIIDQACVAANEVSTFQVEPYTGDPAFLLWEFGDGSSLNVSSSTSVTYTYTTSGTYTLSVNITNPKSFKSNSTTVCVEERISGFTMALPGSYVEVGVNTAVTMAMTTGSNYTCNFQFTHEDSTVTTAQTVETDGLTYNHIFPTAGNVTVYVNCSNGINWVEETVEVRAVERITGHAITPPGAMANVAFSVTLNWTTGTDVQVTLTYDGAALTMTVDEANKQAVSPSMSEPVTGLHNIVYTVSNPLDPSPGSVNAIFSIEVAITNPDIDCQFQAVSKFINGGQAVIESGTDVHCTATMDDGTSVVMELDYKDGTSLVSLPIGVGVPWSSSNITFPVVHTFNNPGGLYDFTVTLRNGFNSYSEVFNVWVMVGLGGVRLKDQPPEQFLPPATVSFDFEVTGPKPNDVTCYIEWGDGNDDEFPCDVDMTYEHVYLDRDGELPLTYRLWNHFGEVSGAFTVYIVTPIIGNECFTNPTAAAPGVPLDFVFKTWRGPAAGILDLTFDCDIDTPVIDMVRKREHNSPDGEDVHQCTFGSRGNYTMLIVATSQLENKTCYHTVEVINPVTEDYTFAAINTPMDYNFTGHATVDYVLNYYGGPVPDNAWIEFDYGDGNTAGPMAFLPSYSHSHPYAGPGHYVTTITIYNDASTSTRQIVSGCYTILSGVTMQIMRQPLIPVGADDTVGYGVGQDHFRSDELLKIHANAATGTLLYWEVTAQSPTRIYTCNSTDPSVIEMLVEEVGTYEITVTAINPISQPSASLANITIMQPINGSFVTDEGNVTNAYDEKDFIVSMDTYGTDMCCAVDFGDSSGTAIQLYGDPNTCNVVNVPDNMFPGATLYYNGGYTVSAPFNIRHQYTNQGSYTLKMYSWTDFSSDYTDFQFSVTGIDCSAPNIDIKDRRRNFMYPLEFERSKRVKIVGVTSILCPNTLKNTKNWTAIRWNDTTNEPIETISMDSVPSAVNSELAFEPTFLTYGAYLMTYKVTMLNDGSDSGAEFSGSAETFIKVIKSPLVVQLFENSVSRISVGPAQVITLAPIIWSYDPDVNINNGEIDTYDSFEMACRDLTVNETFPDQSVKVTALNLTDLPPLHVDGGGCFQQGAGWIDNFDGSVTFRTDILKINHTYEFYVWGYKDERSAFVFGQIDVLQGDPPEMKVDFKIPEICFQGPKGKMFNPNTQLGLIGSLVSPNVGHTYSYFWEMFAYDYQYCGHEYNCWRNLAYLVRYIEGSDGTKSEELTIHTQVFTHYHEIDTFQVRLEVTNEVTSMKGSTYMNLTRNNPPSNGSCTISPSNGTALTTNFTIDCRSDPFIDKDGDAIINHKVICQLPDRTVDVASGDNFWEAKFLPVGDADDSYILKCNVSVYDDKGAIGNYPLDDVVVEPMPLGDMRGMLLTMQNNEDDISDLIDAVANLDETSSYANAVQNMLNVLSADDEFSAVFPAFANMGTALSYASTSLDSNETRPGAFETIVVDDAKKEEYENVRDAGAKLVYGLITTLTKCTVESIEETERMADTVSALSSSAAFIHREAQGSITNLLELGVQNMKNNLAILSVESIQSIGQSTLDACSNLGQAGTLAMDHPTNTDIETQADAVSFFSSNMDTAQKDVGTFANDKEALYAGKHIMNKDVQGAFAAQNLGKCRNIENDVGYLLASRKPKSNESTILKSGSMETAIMKNDAQYLQNKTLTAGGCAVALPDDIFVGDDGDDTLIMMMTTRTTPGAPLEENSPMSRYSREFSIGFKYPNGTDRRIYNLATPIELGIKQDPNQPRFNTSELTLANPEIIATRENEYLFYHQVYVTNTRSAIQLRFSPTNQSTANQLLVLVNFEDLPDVTDDGSKVKEVCMIPSHTSKTGATQGVNDPDPYTCFIDADIVGDYVGEWKIGVRQLLPTELDAYPSKAFLPNAVPEDWKSHKEFTQNYMMYPVVLTCAYTESGSSVVKRDGVKPTSMSNEDEIKCSTTHLTTFAGGWAVAPNTIDWNFVFSNADFLKNPTLYVTEMVIILIYIIAMIWARRKDRQDLTKLGLAPLLDNDPKDKYYYEIMVSTGMRRGAGTESKVHFILSGEEEETDVRTFTDNKRQIFTRGSTDGFLMAVREPIGALTYLRIWHDNSGKGSFASWYLNHVLVRDVQTDKKYYFIANRWFAVEEDDGQVDRIIPVAGKEQMTEFTHLFQERATKNLSDGHLWFSVLARPPQSRFTRCQRVSCCLCLLFTSMLANAMFYSTASSDANAFQFGPFAITAEQIFIGVAANLIIFPVNFLLLTIFRKSRPRKLRPSRVEEALKSVPERSASMADVNMREKSSTDFERPGSSFLMDVKRSQSAMSCPPDTKPIVRVEKKKKCELPWWFLIIGWILLFLTVLVSAAFVTFYGIMFQDIKCKKWITSMLVSFFTSIFFTQPIKVFLFAIIFSLIIKNPGSEDEEEADEEAEPRKLKNDEEYLHDDDEDEFGIVSPRKPLYKPKPPDSKVLEEARQKRLKEIQMWAIIREILFYAFFLWILLVISYKSVSTDSYNYKHNMQKVFITTNDTKKAFSKVHNQDDFWVWAKSGMLRGLRAGPYYNNFPPFYMRGYINDKQSRLMGYAVLRQVRIEEPDTCKVPAVMEDVISECNSPYEITFEQDQNYGPGWTSVINATREEYIFQDADTLNGYPYWGEMALYGGGGYVVTLNKDYFEMIKQFNTLEDEGWIDKYTRAVFLEFTVYNPSINLFSVSTLLAEFRPSGGVFTSFRFEPCNLLPYMSSALLFQIVCEVFYLLFTLFFVGKLIKNLYKEKLKFFSQFWNLIDLGICAMSVTAVVIYFYRLVCINELTSYFKETNGNEYMKFQYVGYWSEMFNYIVGFLVFCATLKFLKLLRFNRRISLLADTLNNSSKDLIHFSIIFNIVFLAFIQLFYLIYGKHLDIFKTFTSSCEAGIVMMMGKFDIYNMLGVNQWLTQIFLFLFVVTVTFIVVNMLLSILNDTFSAVRNDLAKQKNDYEIIDFMMGRFKMWTGIGKGNTTISPEDLEKERNKNYRSLETQIDHFPDQIDRFLASVSNMYMGDVKFDNMLQKGMAKKMAEKAAMQEDAGEFQHPAPRYRGAVRLSNGARGMTDVQTD